MRLAVLILTIAMILTGCTITGNVTEESKAVSYVSEDGDIEVYFCPAENCSSHLVDFIDSAQEYVHCAVYDIDLPEVIDALEEKAKSIDVRVVVDNDNYAGVADLEFVRKDTSSQLMHNKFCVADGNKVFTGSFNPTLNDDRKNDNNILVITSKYLAENYYDEFSELWNGEFGKGAEAKHPLVELNGIKINNYFCPEDECASHIIDAIREAKQSIYFMTFTFTSENIANMLALKMEEGIDVKGVFEKTRINKWAVFDFLKYQEADVLLDSNKYVMHHKVFLIDNETVITGSMNPTWSADNENDENVLIIHNKEIAAEFLGEFEKIFNS